MKRIKKYYRPMAVIVIAGAIFFGGLSLFDTLYRAQDDEGLIIAQDIMTLRDIFHRIHKDCIIIDFDAQKNAINFLNVATFTGSEVGPMNLVHPEKWNGPYLKDNPTIFHTAYQVVSTKKGYFVTPGDGVQLPNKKIVGTDIILDKKSDIGKMMRDPEGLLYKDKQLAARLDIGAPTDLRFFLNDEDGQ